MKDAADKRRDIEKQHADAVAQLREKQAELNHPIKHTHKDRQAALEAVEALQVILFYIGKCYTNWRPSRKSGLTSKTIEAIE